MRAERPILCDVEMLRAGLTRRLLPGRSTVFSERPGACRPWPAHNGETRSMAALKLWREHLPGSVVLIGNAPTALFRLLEMIRDNAAINRR